MSDPDPAAVRAAYERQWALLVPVVDGLRDAARGTTPLLADDWRGRAAEAAHEFLLELRGEMELAAEAVERAAAQVRHQLLDLS